MNWLLFGYLFIGYLKAFIACNRAEQEGRQIGLLDTGIIVLVSVFFWLPFQIMMVLLEAFLIVFSKIVDKKLKKS